ncbi:PP2C family protein-serine/threonine phosphatase, partial [Persephonella sp.]
MYRVLYYTDKGLRNYQQDCLYIDGTIVQAESMKNPSYSEIKKKEILVAVCDGMGGLSDGDIASRFVCKQLKDLSIPFSVEGIYRALYTVQKEFTRTGIINSGTTVAGVYMKENKSIIFNVGDSRVYKLTEKKITYISHDHSY